MNRKERNEHEGICPRCGADAQCSSLTTETARIQVMCPDCGRYEMDREEFDQAEADRGEVESPIGPDVQ